MKREQEERITRLAARQHGVVVRRQLLEVGLSRSAIDRLLQSGRFRSLHLGVYLVLPIPLGLTREMAAVLASGEGAVLSHLSAGRLWGLLPAGAPDAPVDVVVAGSRGYRPGIRVHHAAQLGPKDRRMIDNIPTTAPLRTLVDVAAMLGTRELEGAVAHARREGLVDMEALRSRLEHERGHRGIATLRAVLGAAGGPALTRSAAEEKFMALVRSARLPPPECNVRLGGYELDFLWPRLRLAVEVDGFRYHSSRDRFEADRRKVTELAAAGYTVIRLSWRQVTVEAMATAVRVGQALARASDRTSQPAPPESPGRVGAAWRRQRVDAANARRAVANVDRPARRAY